MNKPVPDWIQQTRALLDEQLESIDYATRSRLNQARQQALGEMGRARRQRWTWWIGIAATAGLGALLAFNLMLRPVAVDSSLDALLVADPVELDAELLVASDSLEMYENLEFYAWLQSQAAGS